MDLGLFGGTFNPVHFGHLDVATEVYRRFCFDHIYFIPSKKPPHKNIKNIVSSQDRCEMIHRTLPNNLPFSLSQVEVNRDGPSYAIDTVNYFKSRSSHYDKLSFILGIDAFLEFHTWKSYINLVRKIKLIIVSRLGIWSTKDKKINNDLNLIQNYIFKKISSGYHFCTNDLSWKHKSMKSIYFLRLKPVNISSTLIRKYIKMGKDIDCFIPKTVADYISKKGLYL